MSTKANILVVDDERQIRRVMRVALEEEGYSVREATSGEDALRALKDDPVDLVLLDLNMPGMGGMSACRAIRAQSDVAIVILSVRDSEKDKVEALDAGADDYVTKPFGEPELLARLRAALRRVPVPPETIAPFTLGELTINFATRRVVSASGTEVRLTPKEFDLLQFLVEHPNETLVHGRILHAVWGTEYGGEVEYLRVFVNRLRKKIEPNPAAPRYILTEPWTGYRFQR